MAGQVAPGGVLAHEGKQHLAPAKLLRHPVHDGLGLSHLSGQDQVPDDYALFQQAILQHHGAGLAHHLPNGVHGHLRVVPGGGISLGCLPVQILQIGQVNVHLALQGFQRLYLFISAAVVHHRNPQRLLQQSGQHVGVVGGIDEVDVVGALGDELPADLPQALQTYRLSEILVADFLVLAEHAAQTAPGKKDGARAIGAGNGGLLPVVEGGPGQHRPLGHPAIAGTGRFRSQSPAGAGA